MKHSYFEEKFSWYQKISYWVLCFAKQPFVSGLLNTVCFICVPKTMIFIQKADVL